jgi:hypothetical protein
VRESEYQERVIELEEELDGATRGELRAPSWGLDDYGAEHDHWFTSLGGMHGEVPCCRTELLDLPSRHVLCCAAPPVVVLECQVAPSADEPPRAFPPAGQKKTHYGTWPLALWHSLWLEL